MVIPTGRCTPNAFAEESFRERLNEIHGRDKPIGTAKLGPRDVSKFN